MRKESNWIQTYTGRQFWPTDPRPIDVNIEDIAHALSLTCRFAGHCEYFYSVAQHSVLVSENCLDPREGLMHDSAEAYLSDVSSPIKKEMGPFIEIEDKLLEVIAHVYKFSVPLPESVHEADIRMLATERRDIMMPSEAEWFYCNGIVPYDFKIEPWDWDYAKEKFLERFEDLF